MTLILSGTDGLSDVDGSAATPAIRGTDTNTGIFFPAADTVGVATGGSERVRVDSSGNVGIGTASPSNLLHVSQASSDFQIRVTGTSTANAGSVRAYNAGGEAAGFGVTGSTNSGYGANLGFMGTITNLPQIFLTNNTERMRIDTSGQLLVGGTSSPATTGIFSNKASTGAEAMTCQETTGGASTRYFMGFYSSSNAKVGSITTTGTTTSYVTTSDYRLKENVQPMVGALTKIAALKPVTYTWIADGSAGEGFIAHELQVVVPDAVSGKKDELNEDGSIKPQGIDTSFLVATLTAAIQEQQSLITTLTARITALETK